MKKIYSPKSLLFISLSFLVIMIASCKKDKQSIPPSVVPIATPTQLGLYETDSSIYKLLLIAVSKIGNKSVDYGFVFDTGSGGMVIDADGILPASMISSSGFTFTEDSTVVDGITITNQTSIVQYGDDNATTDKVYGNLAYAPVTIGDQNGNIVIKRLPFFIYYKAVDGKGVKFDAHEFDTFGVSQEYDISFSNNAFVTSPFSYFDPGNGLTKGFKMAALDTVNFSLDATYVPGVITLGLTAADLSSSSGFTMSQLNFVAGDGYAPLIPATITYNNKSTTSYVVFDTGTEPYSYIEDKKAANTLVLLPAKSAVKVMTTAGFNYSFTTSDTENLTNVENPTTSGADVSIISLEFFLNNEYMLDYTNHKLGLKNN
ncbi:MAG: hypothetical protein JWP37_2275 [Mucilaginibacter sp.]|nr:hypothetical protein [Mucilaginibacter sp.]